MALFKEVHDIVLPLLRVRTYTELQGLEAGLVQKGVDLTEDFVWTDERRTALDSAIGRIMNAEGPTIVFAGWYGSGKTTVLAELLRQFSAGSLRYGNRLEIAPIEVRLNEDNTATDFLLAVLDGVAKLSSEELVLRTFRENRALRDLPEEDPHTMRSLVEVLVGQDASGMDKVKKLLFDLFRGYKDFTKGKRIIGLVIDELENITQPERESEPKLAKLLQGLFESAVRELVDRPESLADPDVFVLFDIISKKELEKGGWLRPDVLERSDAWSFDVNLSRSSANHLMRHLLRLYLDAVVPTLGRRSSDERLTDWARALKEHADPDDDLFTYPVTRSVHRAFSHALLETVPATGAVVSFRAYQEGIYLLLNEWTGTGLIDLSFMLKNADRLRSYYGEKESGINLDRLLDGFAVQAYVRKAAGGVQVALRETLSNMTLAALLKSTSANVLISRDDLALVLDRDDMPGAGVVNEVLRQIDQHKFDEWEVVGDSLRVDTKLVIERVTEEISEAERDFLQEAIEETTERRHQQLGKLAQASIAARGREESYMDEGILVVKPKQTPLLDSYFFSFEGIPLRARVDQSPSLSIGVQLSPIKVTTEDELPISAEIILPSSLKRFEAQIASRLTEGLQTKWEVTRLLKDKLVRDYGLAPAAAFLEVVKISLLAAGGDLPHDLREKLIAYERDFVNWFLADIQLTEALRNAWVAAAFGFRESHSIEEAQRLIRVVAWASDASLRYHSRDAVRDDVGVVRAELGTPSQWSTELTKWAETEGFVEGGTLKPFKDWPRSLRDRIEAIDDLLAGGQLGFYIIGEHLLGGASMQRVPGANAMLHLLLRLGAREKDWLVQDEAADYRDVRLSSKSQTLVQDRQKVARKIGVLLENVLVTQLLSGKDGSRTVRRLLDLRAQLGQLGSPEEIKAMSEALPAVDAPYVSQFDVPEGLLYLGAPWEEVGRTLEFVSALQTADTPAGKILHGRLEPYEETLSLEARYLILLKRRNALARALGDAELIPPQEMIVREIAPAERSTEQRAAARELSSKLNKSHLISEETTAAYAKVVKWAQALAEAAVPSSLTSSVNHITVEKIETEIAGLETRIRTDAGPLLSRVRRAIAEIRQALPSASDTEGRTIRKIASRIEESAALAQSLEREVSPAAAAVLGELGQALGEWDSLARRRLTRRENEIGKWLKQHGLANLREEVLAELETARLSLVDVYAKLEAEGHDLEDLATKGGKSGRRIAVLLGAAGILNSLRGTSP